MAYSDDVLDIRSLSVAYSDSFDAADADAWAGIFVADGVFESADGDVVRGHDEMRAWFATRKHDGKHTTVDAVVSVDGDEATQRSTVVVYAIRDGALSLRTLGEYRDELVRTDAGWRFRRRVVRTVASAPT